MPPRPPRKASKADPPSSANIRKRTLPYELSAPALEECKYLKTQNDESNDDEPEFYDAPSQSEASSRAPSSEQSSAPRKRSPRRSRELAPWEVIQKPAKKGISVWSIVGMFLLLPFRSIVFLTRTVPRLIIWPLRIGLSFTFLGIIFTLILIFIYGIKANRYDITQIQRMPARSIVLDRKGTEIGTLHGENRRKILNIDSEVPRYFIDALIIQEDRSYWTHAGVDPRGILRAMFQVLKHRRTTQGASTLTMQLAKNTFNHKERSFDAKFIEIALARRIEAAYDKKTILNCYINRIFWGHTFMGLKQAAYGYFDKVPHELSIGESALLAGIVCAPNQFSPHRNPKAAKIQRDKVLKLMVKHGKITRLEYEYALSEPVRTQWPRLRGRGNYALDIVRTEVNHILRILDTQERSYREDILYSGGLIVKTSIDLDLQDAVIKSINTQLEGREKAANYSHPTRAAYQKKIIQYKKDFAAVEKKVRLAAKARKAKPLNLEQSATTSAQSEDSANYPILANPDYIQSACVVMHQSSGALLAIVGGRNSEESRLNRATQIRRQVGSIFKPLLYASYFEQGYSPRGMLSDDRIKKGEIKGAPTWRPKNASNSYLGANTAAWGLLKSRNTMAVRVGNRVGLNKIIQRAQLAGYTIPKKGTLGPTIYLGTWEASPYEVASSFTTFANGGSRPTPYIIESITDSMGNVIWKRDPTQIRVFSKRASNATADILQAITKPGGTAGAMKRLGFNAPSGGKTGTTNAYRNAWFCGFTSELTAAVWVGFDRPRTIMNKGYGSVLALPIWVDVMNAASRLAYPMEKIIYSSQRDTKQALRLCRSSGELSHHGCEYEGTAYTDSIADRKITREMCQMHDFIAEAVDDSSDDAYAIDPDEEDDNLTPAMDGEQWAIDPDEDE